jgi:SAM-dependent methyltransferase
MDKRMAPADALNAEDWAGEMGERWLQHLDRFESMIAPIGVALLQNAGFAPGQRVVDIGSGGGASAIAIARQVAPGSVIGVDISPVLVAESTRRAKQKGLDNLRFVVADAATVNLKGLEGASFDRLHSRFGSMFFAEPAAAFCNLGSLLKSGGRADFAVWAAAKDSPWVAGLMGVLRQHLDLPKPEPHAPGPFALDDPGYFGGLLVQAGFAQPEFTLWRGEQSIGGAGSKAETAVEFVLDAMSFGDLVTEQPAAVQERIRAELLQLFRAHQTPAGVMMGAIAWLVTARRS